MIEDTILFVTDVAKLFRISPNTLRRKKWREKTGIPFHKVGKQLCGSRSDIERWFKGLNG
jgi:hypothetical protein